MAQKNKKKKVQQPQDNSLNNTNKWQKYAELVPLIPLAFVLLVVPLIMYAKIVTPQESAKFLIPFNSPKADIDAYYKGFWFLIAALLSMIILLGKKLKGDLTIQKSPFFYPLILFLTMAIFSTLMSDYRPVALSGYDGRSEGLYILLAYGAAFFAATQLVKTKKQFTFLLTALWFSTVVMSAIGLLQALGHNPFLTEMVQRLMLPREYHHFVGDFTGTGGGRDVFLTMGNSNYAGGYMAMALSIFLPLMFFVSDRRIKTALILSNGLMLFVLILSGSRAGYVALLVSLALLAVIMRTEIIKRWKLLLVFACGFLLVNVVAGSLQSRSYFEGISSAVKSIAATSDPYPTAIKDITTSDNQLTIVGTEESLVIQVRQDKRPFYMDNNETNLQWETDRNEETGIETHQMTTPGYQHYRVTWELHEYGEFVKVYNGFINAEFFYRENQFLIIGHLGELLPYSPVESFGFKGRERMGSNRGYIWSRSIPLIRETILIGHGPDTFIYYFPQNDYLAVLQRKFSARMIVDKPHNLYLQTAINTGVVSLCALLALLGMYLTKSCRRYFREYRMDWHHEVGISLLAGCTAYVVAGFFNDSVIGVSTVFWVLLGMGTALLINHEKSEQQGQ